MKAPRYLLPVLALLGIAVAAAWYLRNTLIQRFSAPLLAEYGFRISDISLDTLASRDAAIGRLELVHETGTTITIDDLRLPFRADTAGLRSYRAGTVTVVTVTADDDSPFETAPWIERFLRLPHDLAGSDFAVDALRVASHPPVSDLHWVLAADTQALRASIDGIAFSLAVAETGPMTHDLFVSTNGQAVAASLSQESSGFLIGGTTNLDLPAWMPLIERTGMLPEGISVDSGAVSLAVEARIPFAAGDVPGLHG
ncbi:MAG: hypothetical protein OEV41_07255, partial [Gammaproteobacteria bacterium]|nr:hypothetical protein [Gammaproteobacteria bacterium]